MNVNIPFPTFNIQHTFKVSPDNRHFLGGDDGPVHWAQKGGHPVDGEELGVGGEEQEGKLGLQLSLHLLGKGVGAVRLVFDERLQRL